MFPNIRRNSGVCRSRTTLRKFMTIDVKKSVPECLSKFQDDGFAIVDAGLDSAGPADPAGHRLKKAVRPRARRKLARRTPAAFAALHQGKTSTLLGRAKTAS